MRDEEKSKEQLIKELTALRKRNAELEVLEKEHKKIEQALQESEALYRAVVDSQSELICHWLTDKTLSFMNEAYCHYFGKTREQLLGSNLLHFIHKDDHEQVIQHFAALTSENPVGTCEYRVVMPDGNIRWQQWINRVIFDDHNNILKYQSVGRDITDRKQAEKALRDSEAKYRTLVDQMNSGIVIAQPNPLRLIFVNPAMEKILGYTTQELLTLSPEKLEKIVLPEEKAAFKKRLKDRISGEKEAAHYEFQAIKKDGTIIWIDISSKRIEYNDKPAILAILTDITTRKKAEKAQRESELKLRTQFKGIPVPTYTWQKKGNNLVLVDYNDAAFKITRGKIPNYLGITARKLYQNDPEIFQDLWRCFNEKTTIHREIKYKFKSTGETLYLSTKYAYLPPDMVLVHTEDITELKQAEEVLRRSHHELEKMVAERTAELAKINEDLRNEINERKRAEQELSRYRDHLEDLVEARTAELILANKELEQEIKVRKQVEEALRLSETRYRNLFEDSPFALREEDWSQVKVYLDNLKRSGITDYHKYFENNLPEIKKCVAMIKVVDVNRSTMEFFKAREKKEILNGLTNYFTEELYNIYKEAIISLADGKTLYECESLAKISNREDNYISLRISVAPGFEDTLKKVFVSIIDITERKQLEVQLFQSQKMEAIGTLAGGIAHDFNNMLTGIMGYSDLLWLKHGNQEALRNSIDEIRKITKRASALTRQLLTFSRRQIIQPQVLNINSIIIDLEKMLQRIIGEDIELNTSLEPKLYSVRVDPGQFEQVIMNLIINARDAMPEGGKLKITTRNITIDPMSMQLILNARPGNYICLSVEDTGVGISKDVLPHIYEPFFTTKSPGKGTGLGLSVVYGIIKQHEGWINVYSEPHKGTNFKIYLPAIAISQTSDDIEGSLIYEINGQGERILLVEDENVVREVIAKALSENGFNVFEAANAREALRTFEQEKGRFDLLICDVVLPGKSGIELVEELLVHNPRLLILFSSGYTDKKSHWTFIRERGFPFIQKPYTLNDLFRSVKEILKL